MRTIKSHPFFQNSSLEGIYSANFPGVTKKSCYGNIFFFFNYIKTIIFFLKNYFLNQFFFGMSDSMLTLFFVLKKVCFYMEFFLLFLGFNHFIFDAKVYKTFKSKKKIKCHVRYFCIQSQTVSYVIYFFMLLY